jgi:hypothetical protein
MQVTILTSAEDVKRTWGREFVVMEERRKTRFGRRAFTGAKFGIGKSAIRENRAVPLAGYAAVAFPGVVEATADERAWLQRQYTCHPAEEKRTARNHPARNAGWSGGGYATWGEEALCGGAGVGHNPGTRKQTSVRIGVFDTNRLRQNICTEMRRIQGGKR